MPANMSDLIEAQAQDNQHQQMASGQESSATVGNPTPEGVINQDTEGVSPRSGPQTLADITNAADYEQMLSNRDMIMGLKEPDNFGALVADTAELEVNGQGQEQVQPEVVATPQAQNEEGGSTGDQLQDDHDDKRPQFRLRPANDVDEEALRLIKAARAAGEELSLEDGLALAKRKLGIATPVPAAAPQNGDVEGGDDTQDDLDIVGDLTVSQISSRMEELQEEELSAFEDMNMAKVRAVRKDMADLAALKEVAIRAEQTKNQKVAAAADAEFDSSVAKAGELFPDFLNGSSEFYTRCREVDDLLLQTNDPRYNESAKPLMIAQMVAKEMGILPASAATRKAAPAAQQAQPTRQSVAITPKPARVEMTALPTASGSSRTQTPAGASQVADMAAKVRNVDDWEALERELAGRA